MTATFISLARYKAEQIARLAPHYVFVHTDSKEDESLSNQFCDTIKLYCVRYWQMLLKGK